MAGAAQGFSRGRPSKVNAGATGEGKNARMNDTISIASAGRRWAVMHDGGYLGFANSREEALQIGLHLVEWFGDRGRSASLVEEGEAPSFAPREFPDPMPQQA